jgi:Hint domain
MVDTFTVNTTSDFDPNPGNDLTLTEAISDADGDANGAIINFDPTVFTPGNDTYTLTGNLPAIVGNVTIDGTTTDGAGITLDAAGNRGLVVQSGILSIENFSIEYAAANGPGGGSATGDGPAGGGGGGGGGAGLGGGLFVEGGADVTLSNVAFADDSAQGGSGGAGSSNPYGAYGYPSGGGGGSGGGGQGGATGGGYNAPGFRGADGGAGSFGGGGGGGGGGYTFESAGYGGTGGFGAGAGGAGNSQTYGGGGGGALGAGGDIFVQQGGSLTINGGSLAQGTVEGGGGGSGGNDEVNGYGYATDGGTGYGYGDGLFIEGTQSVTFAPGVNETVTISGVIADMTGSNDPSGQTGSGSLIMDGPGELVLSADNMPGSSSDLDHAGFSGGITIEDGTVVLAATGAAGSGAITFDSSQTDPTLEFTPATAPTNEIDGFATGTNLQIDHFIEQSGTYSDGVLTLYGTDDTPDATSETVTLNMPNLSPSDFEVDVVSGTTTLSFGSNENAIACYCRGTLVRTPYGNKRMEKLQIGDEVITASGAARPIKWIGRRSYLGRFVMGRKDILPVCIKAGALDDNEPKRDLWISPNHAMYFKDEQDGVLIEAKDLVNGVSIVQAESVEQVEYFHIELDTHDVIIAEGAPSESFIDDDSRGMFNNAHEYRALYPAAASLAAQYCAPRLDEGYEVEAIRQRLALRAGLESRDEAARAGNLLGFVDRVTPRVIEGWAQNADHPEAPVCLDIYAGGRLIGQVLANRYRKDLEQAGMGSGRHAFTFSPAQKINVALDAIEVRRSLDGALLSRSVQAKLPSAA